jgi:hypothetical protein
MMALGIEEARTTDRSAVHIDVMNDDAIAGESLLIGEIADTRLNGDVARRRTIAAPATDANLDHLDARGQRRGVGRKLDPLARLAVDDDYSGARNPIQMILVSGDVSAARFGAHNRSGNVVVVG